ncbi:MAG: GDP-mannose 4,6-dehydratase [Dehalococcoidia bacterium]|nr:MAG: GDP-mannose 4,6-dehydratase [Dehalococcoidia bacterium]
MGSHLVRHLLDEGDNVCGLYKPGLPPGAIPGVRWRPVELLDPAAVSALVQELRPDCIYHLAGQASVALSWTDPIGTFEGNVETTIVLFEAVLAARLDPVVLVVGSNEVFGAVRPEEQPIGEDAPFRPANPYATSKVAQDYLAYQYALSHRLRTVRVRPFMHVGPGQRPDFAIASFARQIAAIEAGEQEPVIRVGNLNSERDITDVRDIVRAYRLLTARGTPGEAYNIGRGSAYRIGDLLDLLLAMANQPIRVEVDPERLRPSDTPVVICDNRKVRREVGWQPQIELATTLRDTLAYWRAQFGMKVAP